MTNSYFNHDSPLARHTLARAAAINTIATAIASAFDLLPSATDLARGRSTYAADSGAADALVVSMPSTMTAYEEGAHILVKVAASNTGACTINVDGLGVRSIKTPDGEDPAAGDLGAGDFVDLVYDSTNSWWILSGYQRSVIERVGESLAAIEAASIGSYANDAAANASGKTITEGVFYYKSTATKGLRLYTDGAWTDAVLSLGDQAVIPVSATAVSNGVSAVDIALPSGYSSFVLVADVQLSASTSISMRTSENDGSSFDAGGTDYKSIGSDAAQITLGTSASVHSIRLNMNGAKDASSYFGVHGMTTQGNSDVRISDGLRDSVAEIDEVRLFPGTGTFTGGQVYLYGFREFL